MDGASGDAAALRHESTSQGKPKFKSYRKKFYKIRSRFAKVMAENNTLWDGEQNLRRVTRRLEEEMDQLRELLMDINSSETTPKHMLVQLTSSSPSDNSWLDKAGVLRTNPNLERILHDKTDEYDEAEGYCNMAKEYKQELRRGEATLADYRNAYKTALPYHTITRSLGYLQDKVAHTRRDGLPAASLPPELVEQAPLGYMSHQHEAEYLERLDAAVDERLHTVAKAPGMGPPLLEKPPPNYPAKDNPMSALNWLRKHQPQDFPADGEAHADGKSDPVEGKKVSALTAPSAAGMGGNNAGTAGRRESARSNKRGSARQEVLDEEGYVIAVEPVVRQRGGAAKRKRLTGGDDDDVAYHPSKGTVGGGGRKKMRKSALELAAERD